MASVSLDVVVDVKLSSKQQKDQPPARCATTAPNKIAGPSGEKGGSAHLTVLGMVFVFAHPDFGF